MTYADARTVAFRPRPLICERCGQECVARSAKRQYCDPCDIIRRAEREREKRRTTPRTCSRCKVEKLPAEFRVKRQVCIACETAQAQDAPKEPKRPDRPPSWTLRRHLRLLNEVQQEMIAEYGASMCYSCKFLRECQVNVFTGAELPCVEWARGTYGADAPGSLQADRMAGTAGYEGSNPSGSTFQQTMRQGE